VGEIELEAVQIKINECILLSRRAELEEKPYGSARQKFESTQKLAYVDFNFFGALLKLMAVLAKEGKIIGCNGARAGFVLNKLHVRNNFGLAGVVSIRGEKFSERHTLPGLDTFAKFTDVSELIKK
jgi:hypothetical protein